MDLSVLRRLVTELDERCRGRRIQQVFAIPRHHLALVIGSSQTPRLWFAAEPELPHLYFRSDPHPTPRLPPAFAMATRKLARGRSIATLTLLGDDRIVDLRWQGSDGRLILELLPRRSCALLLASDGRVKATWCPRRGRPRVGERYVAPAPLQRLAPSELSEADWHRMARIDEADTLRRTLLQTVDGLSSLAAKEAACRSVSGGSLKIAVEQEIERSTQQPTAARIYSPAPLAELGTLPTAAEFILAPYVLEHCAHLSVARFPTLIEAAAAFFPLRARLQQLDRARRDLVTALRSASARSERAWERVRRDPGSANNTDELRRQGDLLLAHPEAHIEGDLAVVPDDYGDGAPLSISIDPARDLVANAQLLYRKARRADRGRAKAARRSELLRQRIRGLDRLRDNVAEAPTIAECQQLADRARTLQASVDPDRWSDAEAANEPSPADPFEDTRTAADGRSPARVTGRRQRGAGIIAFRSSEGYEILVGRSARANDHLTHRLASRHDWWLHAEAQGAHVVVRNPARLQQPPSGTLSEAAALAAHYSRAAGATKVNVRWTEARHVRRAKGGVPGAAVLSQSHNILVAPRAPEELFAEDTGLGDASSDSVSD